MTEENPLNLDDQLCFAIYAASRAMTQTYRPLLDPLGLTYPQYLVLLVLWESDGIAVKTLGKRLMLDSGTLTPLLKRMERNGLVTRTRSEADNRRVDIHLTEAGGALKDKAFDVSSSIFCVSGGNERLTQLLGLIQELKLLTTRLRNPEAPPDALKE